jgi:hypothetical protein
MATGILDTDYTDSSPTVPEFMPSLFKAASVLVGSRFRGVEAMVMHPRRFYWMAAARDSSGRPYVLPTDQGPNNAQAIAMEGGQGEGFVGRLAGIPVYIDPNAPATLTLGVGSSGTEDIIILAGSRTASSSKDPSGRGS